MFVYSKTLQSTFNITLDCYDCQQDLHCLFTVQIQVLYIFFLLEYEMVDLLHFNKRICPKNLKKSMRMGLKNDLKHILAKHVGNVLQI